MKKITRIVFPVLILLIAILAIAWKLSDNKKKIEEDAKASQIHNTTVAVTTGNPVNEIVSGDFEMIGVLKPFKEVGLTAEASGKLTQVNFKNGDQVSEGKILAAIDNDLLQNELNISRINLEKLEKDVARLSNLVKDGGVTQQQLDDARLGIENGKAKIKSLEKQISMTFVKAPISGVISNKMAEKGSIIGPGMQLGQITQVKPLLMQTTVLEDEVINIKPGQPVKVSLDLFPDKSFSGRITFIDVKADASRRFPVEIEIDNPGMLRAGMNGKAFFHTGRTLHALTVPRDCIVGSLRDAQVYLADKGVARLRKVTTGKVIGDKVQITSGLSPADEIILTGQINLQDGAEINEIK